MRPARIELEIEELVLHGFPPIDRDAFVAGVEDEVAALLTRGAGRREPAAAALEAAVAGAVAARVRAAMLHPDGAAFAASGAAAERGDQPVTPPASPRASVP